MALYYQRFVEEGQEYWWCACGRTASPPFCDGSHKGTGIEPVLYVAKRDRPVTFCGCKRTQNPPLCDGTHET
ncbi:MAG: glutamate synthase [Rhodospirillaceae bacterium]|nr:glutamate synthase [Rhodospirillaceae bacterium]